MQIALLILGSTLPLLLSVAFSHTFLTQSFFASTFLFCTLSVFKFQASTTYICNFLYLLFDANIHVVSKMCLLQSIWQFEGFLKEGMRLAIYFTPSCGGGVGFCASIWI